MATRLVTKASLPGADCLADELHETEIGNIRVRLDGFKQGRAIELSHVVLANSHGRGLSLVVVHGSWQGAIRRQARVFQPVPVLQAWRQSAGTLPTTA